MKLKECYSSLVLSSSSGLQCAVERAVSSNAILWGVVGFLIAADSVHYMVRWLLRRQRRRKRGRLGLCRSASSALCQDVHPKQEGVESVHYYWTQLSDAILQSPRTSLRNGIKFSTLLVATDKTFPEAILCMWEGCVQYVLDEREVLTLLRRAARGGTIVDDNEVMSLASLALLWRLQLVRFVYDAIFIAEDVSKCSDTLDDLDEYSLLFYQAFISPLKEFSLSSSVIFVDCWLALSEELHKLRRRRFALQIRNTWSLAKYVCASGWEKLVSCFVMAVLTAVAAHSATAGLVVRERIERQLGVTSSLFLCSSRDECDRSLRITIGTLAGLLTYEWVRLATTTAVIQVTQSYIRTSASFHRNCVKRRLYEALVYTPLNFFDMRDFDDVERLTYYTNDLEGVDVHVHDYFSGMVRAVTAFAAAAAALDKRNCAIVVATVAGSDLLTGALGILRRRCAVGSDDEDDDNNNVDAEEEENGNIATDGMMLRGIDIIRQVHELRPYGADATLMTWWVEHTAQYHQRSSSLFRVSWMFLRFRRLWAIDGLVSLVRWLLPVIVTTYAAATYQTQGLLTEAMFGIQRVLDQALDAPRVVDVVLNNAYKANTLERILDSRHWEEEGLEQCLTTTGSITHADIIGDDEFNNNNTNNKEEEARRRALLGPDADVEVTRIRADGLQFHYPTAQTLDAFRSPVSFDVYLQDDILGVGRLVCVTGPSGCGKTTLLRLLLALYTTEPRSSLMVQLRHRKDHMTDSQVKHEDSVDDTGADDADWFPVTSITRKFLRSKLFGFVPQTATLFPGATIAQNISLQNQVSVANSSLLYKVRKCAEAAGCIEFIDRLPQGLLTPLSATTGWVTPGTVRLSCGQGQQLMLARALFHGGSVLLMDEPTSGLDAASKSVAMTQLRDLLKTGRLRGLLCVTHDPEVLKQADHIVWL